ncbi:MAG: Rossmann-like domain-containing protein [bacterium]
MEILEEALHSFEKIIDRNNLQRGKIKIEARGLSPEEAIGQPGREDFPLAEGNEVMIQAEFCASIGQAFTDHPGNYEGSLAELLELPADSNYHRALKIAAMNAVLGQLKLIDRTVHCRNQGPQKCAEQIVDWLKTNHPELKKLLIIGYQPAIVEECLRYYGSDVVDVTDLAAERIGRRLTDGAVIKNGHKKNENLIGGADFVMATGSTVANNTISELLTLFKKHKTDFTFFGNTIAAVAYLLALPRLCFEGQ